MKANQKGFTIIELGIVLIIIGILAALAIGWILNIREEAHIGVLKSDLSSAYKASRGYYADYPDDQLDEDILKEFGYRESDGVRLLVINGFRDTLQITAGHPAVQGFYEVDKDGRIYKK